MQLVFNLFTMRLFLSILALGAVISIVAFFSTPALKEAKRSKMIEAEIENLRSEAEKINTENNFLREKIEYLKSDHYKEGVAKDRLNLRNMGEKVVVVQPGMEVEDNDSIYTNDVSASQENEHLKDSPNYEKWWSLINGK